MDAFIEWSHRHALLVLLLFFAVITLIWRLLGNLYATLSGNVRYWRMELRRRKAKPYYQSGIRQYLHVLFVSHKGKPVCICPVCFCHGAGQHKWNGCICDTCGEKKNIGAKEHHWDGKHCNVCGICREHDFENDRCRHCGEIRYTYSYTTYIPESQEPTSDDYGYLGPWGPAH